MINPGHSITSSLQKPNIKISFGDNANFHIQFYISSPPNKFQRWMTKKLLGINIEDL